MVLREKLSRLTTYFRQTVDSSCLTEKDIAPDRKGAATAFPKQCGWHPLRYPGEISLPIFLMPLAPPLAPQLRAAVADLHTAMHQDGFTDLHCQISSRFEQRQAHLWLAELAKAQYLPIGQSIFILEHSRYAEAPPSTAPTEPDALRLEHRALQSHTRRWWLHHVWLRPAYRCQRIFRRSVPYLNGWHPGFLVRDPGPPLTRALKEHPEHVFDADVSWF